MSDPTAAPTVDLPQWDPGVPRLVYGVGLLALAAALYVGLRPAPAAGLPTGVDAAPSTAAEGGAPSDSRSGAALFLAEGCGGCHPTAGDSTALGPSLAGAAGRAARRVRAPDYTGTAMTAEDYLREAILDHCVDVLPRYDCPAAPDVGLRLSTAEVDRLVGYVAQLGSTATPAPAEMAP